MMNDHANAHVIRLFRFMRLFGITLFRLIRAESDSVSALIAWEEDLTSTEPEKEAYQEILWIVDETEAIDDALMVGELFQQMNRISIDRIDIDEGALRSAFRWDAVRSARAIATLFAIRVWMIDEGEKTDYFLLHD